MEINKDLLAEIKERIDITQKHIDSKQTEYSLIKKQIEDKEKEEEALLEQANKLLVEQSLLNKACKEGRKNGRELLSQITTTSIKEVFGENSSVLLYSPEDDEEDGSKNSTATTKVYIQKQLENGDIVNIDPSDADGGGLADITSLSLFMSLGQMLKNNFAPYVLDEPTKFVNGCELINKSANYIRNIVDFLGKQTIMSTNEDIYAEKADTVYRMVIDEDTSISTAYKEK